MMQLMERADPARDTHADKTHLRAKVDERIALSATLTPAPARTMKPWLIAIASFAAVIAVAVPVALRGTPPSIFAPELEGIAAMPGIEEVVPLASGGVQTAAADGNAVIWVMTALANQLQRVSTESGEVTAEYEIDGHVEGVVVGGGHVWLTSYANGGEVLRFDPARGVVDLTVPIGGAPGWSQWFGDSLWISNDQGDLHRISAQGEIVSTTEGELKGQGLGYLWVSDHSTGLISSIGEDGAVGQEVIPNVEGSQVRQVTEVNGRLWLMDGDYPWGTNLYSFDPGTGELEEFGGVTFGLLDMVEFDKALWVTSHTDHLLIRIDPESGEMRRFPMPGKAGGLVVDASGSFWLTLYHPGALIRLDTDADLIESSPIVTDDWNRFPHRLLCTGSGESGGPTVILQPSDWIDYGSWSVIQAELSSEGHVVCSNGYLEGETTPQQQAADLEQALSEAGLSGPYVLAAAVDGVHAVRLFADGRDDIAGIVLVDPMPVGFQDFYDDLLPDLAGHPPWLDLDGGASQSLDDFGNVPLTVIEQDPDSVFQSRQFVEGFGREPAEAVNTYWQDGLAGYEGLSSSSRSVIANGSGLDMVIWDHPDLVIEQILDLLRR